MFSETWRRRFGLERTPFGHGDADHDPVLARVPRSASHPLLERLAGDRGTRPLALVFGARGSGKSALRLCLGAALRAPRGPLVVEILDPDPWLEEARRKGRRRIDGADALDLALSALAKEIGREVGEGRLRTRALPREKRRRIAAFLALFHPDHEGERTALLDSLERELGHPLLRAGLAIPAAVLALLPIFVPGMPLLLAGSGMAVLLGLSFGKRVARLLRMPVARALCDRSTVVRGDARRLAGFLRPGRAQNLLALRQSEAIFARRELLQGLVQDLVPLGFTGVAFLVDRLEESAALLGEPARMAALLEPLLRELQGIEGVSLQCFLPLVLRPFARRPGQEGILRESDLKRALVSELRWSGQELIDLLERRLRAASNGPAPSLSTLLGQEIALCELRDTLLMLGTPRLAQGFLDALLEEHRRDLPTDLAPTSEAWAVPRALFERLRAAWWDIAAEERRTPRQVREPVRR